MAGKKHREKGDRLEREVVNLIRSYELEARRVPLSGSVEGYEGDVVCMGGVQIECKARSTGFTPLYNWLNGNDALVIKQDRKDPLIVLNLARFCRLLRDWERNGVAANGRPVDEAVSDSAETAEQVNAKIRRLKEKFREWPCASSVEASGKE